MITIIDGGLGTGKTFLMTILGYDMHLNEKRKAYSNYRTLFSEMINPLDLIDFQLKKCVLLLDEIHTFFDSRLSMSRGNRFQSYSYAQTRKLDVDIIGTTQMRRRVDYALTDLADELFRAQKNESYYVDREGKSHIETLGFNYFRDVGFENYVPLCYIPMAQAKKYFHLYDTNEIITPFVYQVPNFGFIEKMFKENHESKEDKKRFVLFLRSEYPRLTIDKSKVIFELMRIGEEDRVKHLLNKL